MQLFLHKNSFLRGFFLSQWKQQQDYQVYRQRFFFPVKSIMFNNKYLITKQKSLTLSSNILYTTYCTLCGHTAQSNIRDFDIWCFGVLNASTGFVKLSCSRGCFAERACCCAFIQTHTRHQAASATFIIFCVSYVSDTSRVYPLCVMHIIKSTESEQKT